MKRLLAYLKPHKWVMTAATVLVLFIIVVELRMRRVLFLIMTLT